MESSRTSTLFHYTRNFGVLKKILTEGFRPNYCGELFSESDKEEFVVGVPMVSFCDIPLTRTGSFVKRYGHYAIGLKKEWGERNGINPILYATPNSKIIPNLQTILKLYEKKNNEVKVVFGERGKEEDINGDKFAVYSYTSNQVEDFVNDSKLFLEKDQLLKARLHLFGFTKSYDGYRNSVSYNNYEENEWRYVDKNEKWFWGKNEYSKWRGNEKIKPTSKLDNLKFEVSDVNFILLKNDDHISGLVNFIDKLTSVGGNGLISQSDKDCLKTLVISMDRINKDF